MGPVMQMAFTRHARARMRQRGIPEEDVRYAIENYNISVPGTGIDTTRFICNIREDYRVSAVVKNQKDGTILVITVFAEEI